jgi:hypothetical protein
MKLFLTAIAILFFVFSGVSKDARSPGVKHHKGNQTTKPIAKNKEKMVNSSIFFLPSLKVGEKHGNIFSRTMAFSGKDFKAAAKRASGTCVYTVNDNNPSGPIFDTYYNYDGAVEGNSKVMVTENGSKNGKPDGKEIYNNTDGSGLLFNSLIWGTPPKQLQEGTKWTVNIDVPWELGGVGQQTVTVMEIDEAHHMIRLEREGTSEGFFDHDLKELDITNDGKNLHVQVIPGTAHWKGHTTFKNGLVISDELMVTRPVTLTAENQKFDANEREYILLNEMP